MATTRGTARKNIRRAQQNALRIVDRLFYLVELYEDRVGWSEGVKLACVNAQELATFIGRLDETLP